MMGVHVDITGLKAQEARVQAQAEEVRRFAFIAAHDLVQPINTIENALSIVLEGVPDSDDADQGMALKYLNRATTRMRGRINGILDYARLQDEALEFEAVDIRELVDEALEDLSGVLESSHAEISVGDLPVATGAHNLLLQVVQNLLSNALKFRDQDKPCRISIYAVNAPYGKVAFCVEDNGMLMSTMY